MLFSLFFSFCRFRAGIIIWSWFFRSFKVVLLVTNYGRFQLSVLQIGAIYLPLARHVWIFYSFVLRDLLKWLNWTGADMLKAQCFFMNICLVFLITISANYQKLKIQTSGGLELAFDFFHPIFSISTYDRFSQPLLKGTHKERES